MGSSTGLAGSCKFKIKKKKKKECKFKLLSSDAGVFDSGAPSVMQVAPLVLLNCPALNKHCDDKPFREAERSLGRKLKGP